MLIYISLIAIIVLSLITGLITTIIENKDLIAQRTMVFNAIKEESNKKATQEIKSVPQIKKAVEILDITQDIEILDFNDDKLVNNAIEIL